MNWRAASSASLRNAKQELVRLLFGARYTRVGRYEHRRLDYAVYCYTDLRTAFLQRAQVLHPDKLQCSHKHARGREASKKEFVALMEAWNRYDEIAKTVKGVGSSETSANFTMFGVGCSFSDNDDERLLREKIMDQACRGWFSSGPLGVGGCETDQTARKDLRVEHTISFITDDDFVEEVKENAYREHSVKPSSIRSMKHLVGKFYPGAINSK
jgi:hypothetical protein